MGPNDMISRKRRAPPSFTLVIEKKDTVAMLRQENPIKLLEHPILHVPAGAKNVDVLVPANVLCQPEFCAVL